MRKLSTAVAGRGECIRLNTAGIREINFKKLNNMEENNKGKQLEEKSDEYYGVVGTWTIISVIVCGLLGLVCHFMFGWNTWISIIVGGVIGFFLPSIFIAGKEEIKNGIEEENGKGK